ncbi:MAG TPA: NAD(P)-binding domain-containing protein [Candidatus Nitrosotalea sp.]|nr:NAD(P)-binding domain-containing protein [Candidatus Nitrosotalea sp.]
MSGKGTSSCSDKKILVIGLGQIGHSNAEYMTSLGLDVYGYDISKEAVNRALRDGVIKKAAEDFRGYDYYVICVSTHRPEEMFAPYLDGLIDVARRLSHEGKTDALVGIDSTVTKGTTQEVKKILGHRLHVVHVPHRFYVHEKEEHGVRQTRVIGGCDPCCIREGMRFYGKILGIPLHPTNSAEVAELTKIVENSSRYLEIAFAEEIRMVCENLSIDFNELQKAINTKWNTKILEARDGIGGHCLPKDSQMFLDISRNVVVTSMVRAAKMVDQQYRFHLQQRAAREVPLARG